MEAGVHDDNDGGGVVYDAQRHGGGDGGGGDGGDGDGGDGDGGGGDGGDGDGGGGDGGGGDVNPFTVMISLKKTTKVQKLNPLGLFVFIFAQARESIFIKTHSFESSCVIGPENILFAGASVHLSARKFYRLGQ